MKKATVGAMAIMLAAMLLYSCNKDSPTAPDQGTPSTPSTGPLTAAEKDSTIRSYKSLSTTADSILATTNPEAGFAAALPRFKRDPRVDTAWVFGSGLYVKFKKGGRVAWYNPTSVVVPPYDQGMRASSGGQLYRNTGTSELVGDSTALLINQQFNDQGRQYCRDLIDHLTTKFQAAHYTVTVKNGSAANVSFFKTGLTGYGAIFYISHGMSDGTKIWQVTGEEGNLDTLISRNFDDWFNDYLSVGTVTEKRAGAKVSVTYYMFSNLFISHYYTSGFKHSLVYLVACQAFKGSTAVGQAFTGAGAAATVGWDETNCLGQSTGRLLFDAMLGGATLGEAIKSLPAEAKLDKCEVPAGASLTYYPASGNTLQLVQKPKVVIQITSPAPFDTVADRVQTLAGSLLHAKSITGGTVEVGGVATTLRFSGTTFSQEIDLKQGPNAIKISCNGTDSLDKPVHADSAFTVIGKFPILDLWTELRWNATGDVDFHLLPPGSDASALWTSADCCYHYRNTSWGGALDVDNTAGYGPEHITIPAVTVQGTYTLYVHFYKAKPDGQATSASVTVSVKGGNDYNFGPDLLTNGPGGDNTGDVWKVCTITYPAGTVTAAGQLIAFPKLAKGTVVPPKYPGKQE
jgi:uncharacterized protein YfaP (DUF2135 family)